LKVHEKNYSPFLLEAVSAVWGKDFVNEYLQGKQFILYMDHKPLEKLVHLYSKTLNRLKTALLEHNFIIQYKKGSNIQADSLSRLLGTKETIASISAFDPFQADLFILQMHNDDLQMLQTFMTKNEWPPNLSRQDQIYFKNLAEKAFKDKNKIVWIRLTDFNYPRVASYLPS